MRVLNDGRPVFVEGHDTRIGQGPWARWLATSVVRDESSPRAERGRILARTGHVHTVVADVGEITAIVIGSGGSEYRVSLAADPVPPRVWSAVIGSTRGRALFQAAAEGREQSLQLEHVMTVDWEHPLVPPSRALRRSCTCPDSDYSGTCKHVIALAYVVAAAIDDDPSLLLEWRGCAAASKPFLPPAAEQDERTGDPWAAGPLPELAAARRLPVGSVLKRLGASGLVVDGADLRDVLQPAYEAFAGRSV
jgi:SWIM zinc finger